MDPNQFNERFIEFFYTNSFVETLSDEQFVFLEKTMLELLVKCIKNDDTVTMIKIVSRLSNTDAFYEVMVTLFQTNMDLLIKSVDSESLKVLFSSNNTMTLFGFLKPGSLEHYNFYEKVKNTNLIEDYYEDDESAFLVNNRILFFIACLDGFPDHFDKEDFEEFKKILSEDGGKNNT